MSLLFFKLEPEDIYLLVTAIVCFVGGFASFISALYVIYSKAWKPIRDRFNQSFFKPLEEATGKIADFGSILTQLSERLASLEETLKTFDLSSFANQLSAIAADVAYLKFKMRRHTRRTPEPTFIFDDKMNCNFVNYALCDLMDADSSELEDKDWLQKILSEERGEVLREWKQAYDGHTVFEMVYTVVIDGKRTKIHVQAEPFIYEGKVRNYFGTVRLAEANEN